MIRYVRVTIQSSETNPSTPPRSMKAATAAARAEVFGKLAVGDVVTGKVARITSFGAFIDLGGG